MLDWQQPGLITGPSADVITLREQREASPAACRARPSIDCRLPRSPLAGQQL